MPILFYVELAEPFSLNIALRFRTLFFTSLFNRFYQVKTSVFWIVSKKPTSKARIIKNKLETAGVDIKRDELPLASVHHAKF